MSLTKNNLWVEEVFFLMEDYVQQGGQTLKWAEDIKSAAREHCRSSQERIRVENSRCLGVTDARCLARPRHLMRGSWPL